MSTKQSKWDLIRRDDGPMCPYCRHKHNDCPYEHFKGQEECTEIECEDCGKTFGATQNVSVTYDSYVLDD